MMGVAYGQIWSIRNYFTGSWNFIDKAGSVQTFWAYIYTVRPISFETVPQKSRLVAQLL